MTKQQTDKWGNEVEETTPEHKARLKQIRETGERLEFSSAGAVRKKFR
jgi:uncharacterized protein YciI